HERFLEHERCVLPPDGGDHDPVDLSHQPREVVGIVRAVEGDGVISLAQQLVERSAKRFRLKREIADMDRELNVRVVLLLKEHHGAKENVEPLVGVELAEEPEAISTLPSAQPTRGRLLLNVAPVLEVAELLGRDPPFSISLGEELTRTEKEIH